MTYSEHITGYAVIIEQEPGQGVSRADWDMFSVEYRLVHRMSTTFNYSADHPDVGIDFTPERAEFGTGPGGEADTAALAMAFAARFGGAVTVSPLMLEAVRRECQR